MSERKDYQEEIRNLRAEASQERSRCDEELRKLREHFEGQRASDQQVYNAKIETLREEIRKLIAEVATLKAEAAHR
jgi:polyhydroxyalkanoate synthesis regulator phasin